MMNAMTILATMLAVTMSVSSAHGQIRIIPARATMLADTRAIAPGQTFTIGVLFTIEPEWHIYWINPGDAGLATTLKLELPDGFAAGPIQYPTPIRFMQSAEVVGYGYTEQVMLMATITAPHTLPAGPITLEATASWLCCKEFCLPGQDKLELKLPVTDAPRPANLEQFEHWKERIPRPAENNPAADVAIETLLDHHYAVKIAWKNQPAEVRFFPASGDALRISDISLRTEGSTTTIRFAARVLPGETLDQETLPIVVAYHQGNEPWRGIEAQVPLTESPNVAQPQE